MCIICEPQDSFYIRIGLVAFCFYVQPTEFRLKLNEKLLSGWWLVVSHKQTMFDYEKNETERERERKSLQMRNQNIAEPVQFAVYII